MESNFLQVEMVNGYFNFIIMLASVNMLWYVSTIVYLLSILKIVKDYRDLPLNDYTTFTLIIFKGFTLLTIILYGVGMYGYIDRLNIQFNLLIQSGKYIKNDVSILFEILKFSYLIQSCSFILFLIMYLYIVASNENPHTQPTH
jgi:hypothetical protein